MLASQPPNKTRALRGVVMSNIVDLEDVDLNKWKWLRKISAADQEAVNHYRKLASINEVMMIKLPYEDSFNIYIAEQQPKQNTNGEHGKVDSL